MNNFKNRVENEFHEAIRKRGQKYFSERRVSDFSSSNSTVTAKVTGHKIYTVHIDWGKKHSGRVYCECNCPHYQQGNLCKHIWAVVLDIEARRISVTHSEAFQKILLHAAPDERPKEEPRAKPKEKQYRAYPPQKEHPSLLFFKQHGISLNSNYSEIDLKKAYRKLTKKFHPDSGGSHNQFLDLDRHHKALKMLRGWK